MSDSTVEGDALPERLYHYTDAAGLHGILKCNALWATHVAYLNDSQEFHHGIKLIRQVLKEMRDNPPSPVTFLDTGTDPRGRRDAKMLPGLLTEALNTSMPQTAESLRENAGPYAACLSAAGDRLSQWRGYGTGGGYAIRFDRAALQQSVQQAISRIPPPTRAQFLPQLEQSLVMVEYDSDARIPFVREQMTAVVVNVIKFVADAIENRDLTQPPSPDLLQAQLGPALSAVLALATRLKHPGFEEENECRIVAYSDPDFFSPNDIGLIPRIEIKFDTGCITGVMVGPGQHMDTRESSVRAYLRKHEDRYPDVEVGRSGTPFTGR